jgi:hypothetical protein
VSVSELAAHIMRLSLLLLVLLAEQSAGVDHAKFRTCAQTGFCRRRRTAPTHPYVVAPGSLSLDSAGSVRGELHGGEFGVSLTMQLLAYTSGVARLRITETTPLHGPRWEPSDILEADIRTAPLRPVGADQLGTAHPLHAALAASEAMAYAFGADNAHTLVAIHLHPFRAHLYIGTEAVLSLNPGGKVRRAALGRPTLIAPHACAVATTARA